MQHKNHQLTYVKELKMCIYACETKISCQQTTLYKQELRSQIHIRILYLSKYVQPKAKCEDKTALRIEVWGIARDVSLS